MNKYTDQRGQILPLAGMSALVLMGAIGFAVDVGYHQYRQRVQQTATDSAALAAGSQFGGSYVAAALQDAQSNGYTDGSSGGSCTPTPTVTCVVVSKPPVAPDAFAGQANAVEVVITAPNSTFFEKVFGVTNVYISTKAVALLVPETVNQCLVQLSVNGGANFNNGALNAPNCGVTFNGPTDFHNAPVIVADLDCASTCSNIGSGSTSQTTVAPASDPCPAITYCAYLSDASTKPTCSGPSPTIPNPTSGPVILQPGCYSSGATIQDKDVKFTCGLYVIQGAFNIQPTGSGSAGNNVTQSCSPPGGVTLYVDAGGSLTFKDVNVTLSAPTSGDFTQYTGGEQNALVYQVPGNTNTINFSSVKCTTCSTNLSGMFYAPSANLNDNASSQTSSGSGVLVIVGSANFNGGFSGLFGAAGQGNTTIQTAVLGE